MASYPGLEGLGHMSTDLMYRSKHYICIDLYLCLYQSSDTTGMSAPYPLLKYMTLDCGHGLCTVSDQVQETLSPLAYNNTALLW